MEKVIRPASVHKKQIETMAGLLNMADVNQESLSHHLTQSCHLWLLLETSLECEHRLVGTLERWCG